MELSHPLAVDRPGPAVGPVTGASARKRHAVRFAVHEHLDACGTLPGGTLVIDGEGEVRVRATLVGAISRIGETRLQRVVVAHVNRARVGPPVRAGRVLVEAQVGRWPVASVYARAIRTLGVVVRQILVAARPGDEERVLADVAVLAAAVPV